MAKLIRRTKVTSRRKKFEHFKMRVRNNTYRLSVFANIYMGLYLYNPKVHIELTNTIKDVYLKVAPIVESLINQLPL